MKSTLKILSLSLGLASCGLLEQEPVSQLTPETFYRSVSDGQAALNATYAQLRPHVSGTNSLTILPWVAADEARPTRGGNFTRTENFLVTPSDGHVNDNWREAYFGIHRANDVIENVPGITDPYLPAADQEARKREIMGQAYFLRGYFHFILTRLYGKVPIVTTTTKSPEQPLLVSRDEIPAVYTQIIADLEEAIARLPVEMPTRIVASQGAAQALLARVLLARHNDGDYQRVADLAEAVISSGAYELVSAQQYGTLFRADAQGTSETIFEVFFEGAAQFGSNLNSETVDGFNPRIFPEKPIIDAFLAAGDTVRFPVAIAQDATGGYFINKYVRLGGGGGLDPNVVLIRLADVILMRAEALNELGQTDEAIVLLNQIRDRAQLPATTAATQEQVRRAILDERFLELAFEGSRWFDLVRTGRAMATLPKLTDPNRIYFPVPAREITLNPNLLPQNESY